MTNKMMHVGIDTITYDECYARQLYIETHKLRILNYTVRRTDTIICNTDTLEFWGRDD